MPVTDKDISSVSAAKVTGLWHVNPWGRTLYVNSAHSRASDIGPGGLDIKHPLATLAKAIFYAQAGDMIVVGPGHTETVTTATALNVNVNDLYIVGCGDGLRRPKFTMSTTTAATFTVSASNVRIQNLHFAPGIDAVAALVTVTGANASFINCYVSDTAGYQAVLGISLAATADHCLIEGLEAYQPNAGAFACVSVGAADRVKIKHCELTGDYSAACIDFPAAPVQILILENELGNLNAVVVCIEGFAGSTGKIVRNSCEIATDAAVTWINTPGACSLFENYGVNDDGETGKLIGTVSV